MMVSRDGCWTRHFCCHRHITETARRSAVASAPHYALKIVSIVDGFVYMSTYLDHSVPGWFLSFCLETAELKKLCPILHDDASYPYVMSWPASLLLNKLKSV